ncbi:FimV/HubP family polar landmark protein [Shewanella polaris]|uniref:LysM peptidoglycan-binding domain-containing protein n=1 Tax=Shewanella polaris TaxID=2588449 RepID=A0A4Y5YJY4_9GAMM|nr:FimV/HubP family polar landmark protein [Shewanella polaris]QDE32846.1 hypothetical protein FH971_18865 [Shewanella polaris]
MKSFKVLAILALLAVDSISIVIAQISNISIDTIPFESGQSPKLTVNIITDQDDLSRLTFYLRQIYQDNIVLEKLDVEQRDGDVFVLSGTEKIRDRDAALIVSEYRNAKWLQYSPVPLFPQTVTQSRHQPVAIKTMKSPSVALSASKLDPTSRNTTALPTQQRLNNCKISPLQDDTLWNIAVRYRKQWGSNIYGAMLALYHTNPSAFYHGKIRLLKRGRSLDCPSVEMLSNYQNVAADKTTFDNLVASQQSQSQAGSTSLINQSVLPKAAITHKVIDPIGNKASDSDKLLAASHETKISPQRIQANNIITKTVDIQRDNKDKICTIDKSPQDTLWRIAERYAEQWHSNVFGAMLAIYDTNPNAFASHKIYLLMSDRSLKCPSKPILMQYQSPSKAQATYEALERLHRKL